MRIGIDLRCLAEGRRTGVEEYTISLLQNIFKQDRNNEYILFFNSYKRKGFNLPWISQYPNVKLRKFKFPNKLLNFLFWYFKWPKIDKFLGQVDILFMPNINFFSVSHDTKLIITIHDLSFERLPENFSLKRRLWHFLVNPKAICDRADKIVTISHSSKSDIQTFYDINSSKIELILPGISSRFRLIDRNDYKFIEVQKKYNLPYNFILFLGTNEPRKNIDSVIEAYENLMLETKETELEKYCLVIAGQTGWLNKNIDQLIENSEYKHKIFRLNYIDEEDKPYFINLASLFVYTSHFEGFGLPPLEAMACGVPVIVSNNSSLPEVIGDAGILINPDKPNEIYQAMLQILSSKQLIIKLRQKGLKRAKNFNWQTTAGNFLKIVNAL